MTSAALQNPRYCKVRQCCVQRCSTTTTLLGVVGAALHGKRAATKCCKTGAAK